MLVACCNWHYDASGWCIMGRTDYNLLWVLGLVYVIMQGASRYTVYITHLYTHLYSVTHLYTHLYIIHLLLLLQCACCHSTLRSSLLSSALLSCLLPCPACGPALLFCYALPCASCSALPCTCPALPCLTPTRDLPWVHYCHAVLCMLCCHSSQLSMVSVA